MIKEGGKRESDTIQCLALESLGAIVGKGLDKARLRKIMKKIYIVRIVNITIYTILSVWLIHDALFYKPYGFAGGRSRGAAIGIVGFLLFLLITMPFQFYKETKSVPRALKMTKETFMQIISFSWFDLILKKWRKFKKRFSHK